jgi:hypothetical protein
VGAVLSAFLLIVAGLALQVSAPRYLQAASAAGERQLHAARARSSPRWLRGAARFNAGLGPLTSFWAGRILGAAAILAGIALLVRG